MKIDELKLKIVKTIEDLIDVYYGENDFTDKMINSTLKILLSTHINEIESFIKVFANKEGEVNSEQIVKMYADKISSDGVKFDIKDYIKNDLLKSIMPDKYLIITKDDILKIIENKK